MVSALWSACADGRLEDVAQLLIDATSMDIELKDPTGLTPLIVAVQNGHVDVVSALLDKGADPLNASHEGPPMQYTTEPAIIELLRSKIPEDKQCTADSKSFYPSSVPYAYYPPPPPSLPEGTVYYPPAPENEIGSIGGPGNLPPPDIAKLIPCRYFPACRYGTSCIFAHPQGPYFQGSLPPPAHYPAPYDPVNPQQYSPNFYPMPPMSYQPQNQISSTPVLAHGQSPPDVNALPPLQPFNGTVPQYPPPMTSPSLYPHTGQLPVPPPIPPLHQQPPPASTQSQPLVYPPPPATFHPAHSDSSSPYPPVVSYPLPNGVVPTSPLLTSQPDPSHRDSTGPRRGTGRRPSSYGRKPPCLFFPSGKCKNGDDCRFPHILSEASQNRSTRARVNGMTGVEEKFASVSIRDDSRPTSRSQSSETAGRPRYPQGKNGHQQKRPQPIKQRVPNADDFPVLCGSTSIASRPTVNGHFGPTAAQILQAPAPARKENIKESHTPPNGFANPSPPEVNGKLPISFAAAATGPAAPDIAKEVSVSA